VHLEKFIDFLKRESYLLTKHMRHFSSIVIVFLLFLILGFQSVAVADIIRPGSLLARSSGGNVVLNWVSDDETNVLRYEIERRAGTSGDFGYIASVDPKGPSFYEFIDHSAYRASATLYQYRVKVVFSDGSPPQYFGPVSVIHSVSGVRRTWGSIKAMFR
jgi:hypothetical protein